MDRLPLYLNQQSKHSQEDVIKSLNNEWDFSTHGGRGGGVLSRCNTSFEQKSEDGSCSSRDAGGGLVVGHVRVGPVVMRDLPAVSAER